MDYPDARYVGLGHILTICLVLLLSKLISSGALKLGSGAPASLGEANCSI